MYHEFMFMSVFSGFVKPIGFEAKLQNFSKKDDSMKKIISAKLYLIGVSVLPLLMLSNIVAADAHNRQGESEAEKHKAITSMIVVPYLEIPQVYAGALASGQKKWQFLNVILMTNHQ